MSNIIDMFEFKCRKEMDHDSAKNQPNESLSFEEQAKLNKANANRVKAERDDANRRLKYKLGLGNDNCEKIT